jgi:CheY-like chemotaxis protein
MTTRILVVDDSPTIRTVVSTILERCGYDPKVASDGQDAYDALASGEVKADLILLDFVMPHMNGYQFCRALRENADLAGIPVVLMSAKADRIRDQFVEQTGALDAISKPFDRQALVSVIENALRRVNTARVSSARVLDSVESDLDGADLTGMTPIVMPEYETRRTHIAQLIGQKLARITAQALAEHPQLASGDLAAALEHRLTNETVLEMMDTLAELDRVEKSGSLLAGDLGVVPIGAILQLLQSENQTGVLVCSSSAGAWRTEDPAGTEVRATFRNGLIDLVQSTGAGDEFRLGRFFIEEGVLTSAEIEEITQRQESALSLATKTEEVEIVELDTAAAPAAASAAPAPVVAGSRDTAWGTAWSSKDTTAGTAWSPGGMQRRPLGMALLAAGKIVESQLRTALTRQSSELLYEVLRWQAGRFELRREPPSELAVSARLGMPVASVVMEGFRRVDEWRALERTLGSFDAVLFRDDAAFGSLDIQSLPAKEKTVLDAVDGQRTVRAIVLASHQSSFEVCRILVQFLEARVLRRRTS